jgi:antitoxin (DNA-binding transcriptional repressor) of toxin-antitoxin stability system
MERLQLALVSEGGAPTLADGGEPVADIAASYPKADWDAVCGEMFLEP